MSAGDRTLGVVPTEHPEYHQSCAVCGRVLDYYENLGWDHTAADRPTADHVAVPVPVDDIRTAYRCDFCLADGARWVLPVRDYVVAPGNVNSGDWSACDTCAGYLQRDEWNRLRQRAMQAYAERNGEQPQEQVFRYMYRQLRKNIAGATRLRS